MLSRSPNETTRSHVREEISFSSAMPERMRSSSLSSVNTDVGMGTPRAVKTPSWVARTSDTSTVPVFSALSAASSRLFVVLPMALSTKTGRSEKCLRTMPVTRRRCSTPASDVPPNFMTSKGLRLAALGSSSVPGWPDSASGGTGTGLGSACIGGVRHSMPAERSSSMPPSRLSLDFCRRRFFGASAADIWSGAGCGCSVGGRGGA
mmetsp:Transcript_47388/g.141436  ORF Transcript_47388/g.141436 Transcript_47388/m.141436 type:complete len:206 (+) Transcript_47388:1105-1722(+)